MNSNKMTTTNFQIVLNLFLMNENRGRRFNFYHDGKPLPIPIYYMKQYHYYFLIGSQTHVHVRLRMEYSMVVSRYEEFVVAAQNDVTMC